MVVESTKVVGFSRYDWDVNDVQKFGERLDEIVRRRVGDVPHPASEPIDWDAQDRRIAAAQKAEKSKILLSRLDGRYREASPRHAVSTRWLQAYRDGRCVNLLINGPTGVGKTWEAAGITRELLLTDTVPVVFAHVPDMLDKLRPNQDGLSDIGQFQAAPVLVLDDLGAEKPSEWVDEQLYRLADFRHNKLLPTIVTANMSVQQLEIRYNDRLMRRLFEGAGILTIKEKPPMVPGRFGAEL